MTYDDDGTAADRDTAVVPTHRPENVAAGWYPDPWVSQSRRYWSGTLWTSLAFTDRDAGDAAGAASRAGETNPFGDRPESPPLPAAPPAWVRPDREPPAPRGAAADVGAPAAPDSSPRPNWAVLLTALAVVLALVLIATFVATRRPAPAPVAAPSPRASTPGAPTPTPPSPSTTPSAPPSAGPIAPGAPGTPAPVRPGELAALARLGLRQSDVVLPVMVLPIDGGTQVVGPNAKTLDLCDGSYPSEALRQARVQVAGYEPDGTARLSTETVRYRSSAAVDQAWTEIQRVAASCSSTSPGTTLGARPDTSWADVAGVRRLAYDVNSTDSAGATTHYVVVYLSRGNVLMGVYFPSPDGQQLSVTGEDTIPGIVAVFEKRLAQMPPSGMPGGSGGGGQSA